MAWKRSSVRSRSGSPNNPLQIKHMPEAEDSPPFDDLVSFGVTRAEGLRRLTPTAPVRADPCKFLRLRSSDFRSSQLMELIVD
jgi:hypothetical protein